MANRRYVADRIDNAALIVGHHDRHQNSTFGNGLSHLLRIQPTVLVHREVGHPRTGGLFQPTARSQNGRMLHLGGNDVVALVAIRDKSALDRMVIPFRPAAGKGDVARIGV